MIIKIDHIAMSSLNFKEYIDVFCNYGYKVDFIEYDLNNLNIKKELMKSYNEKHDLALLTSEKNINIELLNHGNENKKNAFFTPIFEIGDKKLFQKQNNDLNNQALLYEDQSEDLFRFDKILIKSSDLKKSISFWHNFGFNDVFTDDNRTELVFNSIFDKKNITMIIEKEYNDSKYYLDDSGFNCIGFISNCVEREKKKLESKGIYVTEIKKLIVNMKTLNIFFAHGELGEIVEIIGIEEI